MTNRRSACFLLAGFCLCAVTNVLWAEIYHAQGEMVGEVSTTSAILQSRLTSVERNIDGGVAGAEGVARFEYAANAEFQDSKLTGWLDAQPESDFIVKTVIRDLKPATKYYYRLIYGESREATQTGPTCSFSTLQGAAGEKPTSFVVVTGMNYSKFHGPKADQRQGTWGPSKNAKKVVGYPALETMIGMDLDFFVGTGDNVYYDGKDVHAKTPDELRRKWQEQFVQERFVRLFRNASSYWEKDDHDHRYNDCDRVGNRAPSSDVGIAMFREQMPVVDPSDPDAKTYRTYRVNKHLQVWLVEGRDYRSPNNSPNGPDKTLWGQEQLDWLKRTLLESDATFRLLISPTPLVGPDDSYKTDNHVNHNGFRHEGRAFFQWVVDNRLHENGFFTVCGDRHWQYHSADPMGIEEFSCGALCDENARLGRKPGDPKSTDPNAEVKQFYTQKKPSGGFLRIIVGPGSKAGTGEANFTFVDEHGDVLYETKKVR